MSLTLKQKSSLLSSYKNGKAAPLLATQALRAGRGIALPILDLGGGQRDAPGRFILEIFFV